MAKHVINKLPLKPICLPSLESPNSVGSIDGKLNDVRNALDDRLKGIRIQYLPQTIWTKGDKDRAAAMIQAIDKMLKTMRIMRSLESFFGGRRIIAVMNLKIVEWHSYKHLDWITVRLDDDKLYKFKEGDFKSIRKSPSYNLPPKNLSKLLIILIVLSILSMAWIMVSALSLSPFVQIVCGKYYEAYARELEAELSKNIDWDEVIDHVQRKQKEDNAMDYFKGMTYDDIRPIFEKHFDSNVAFLLKTKEQMDEEDSRALKRLSESQDDKTAKKQKLDEEVEELKRHLQIVLNDKDDKEDNAIKRYQALKRKPQTEAQARKNMMIYLRNVAGFKMDYFKGMTYADIRPIFKKHFDSNVAFLLKTKEQMDEEDSRALKRLSENQDDKTAKKYKLDEEVEELKRHLQIVPNDKDDVYTEATPLARKVLVDYEIYTENNKAYYKIKRADRSHQLYLSFLSMVRNFDTEDLEVLWGLIKERFTSTKPKNFSNDFLLTILGDMFEKPDIQAQIWKNQRSVYGQAKVKSWKLLDFGVDAAMDFKENMLSDYCCQAKLINTNQVISQQVTLDDALVAPAKRLNIKRCNARTEFSKPQKEATYQVTLDALKLSAFYPAF
uniref:Uncharacterized protein n=1 Tax=Tanacetum cinerariifolium TaxID=118510 RepID=A0A6L2J826_TANCI|nr:hypothetical protein [Tanacetum cinerariifolium]